MAKSKRLIQLMMVLNSGRKYTVQELADQFGVSYRTMWRDLQDLEELGVPLLSEAGVHGGYQAIRESTLPVTKVQEPFRIEGQLVDVEAISIVGLPITAPYSARSELEVLVPRLWFQLLGRTEEIMHLKRPVKKIGLAAHRKVDFTYYVSVEVTEQASHPSQDASVELPDGFVSLTIPARTYALFTHRGSAERVSVDETFYGIWKWMEREGIERDSKAPWLERYDERFNPTAADNAFDIYIPIRNSDKKMAPRHSGTPM